MTLERIGVTGVPPSAMDNVRPQALNETPHPHVLFAFGFWK